MGGPLQAARFVIGVDVTACDVTACGVTGHPAAGRVPVVSPLAPVHHGLFFLSSLPRATDVQAVHRSDTGLSCNPHVCDFAASPEDGTTYFTNKH